MKTHKERRYVAAKQSVVKQGLPPAEYERRVKALAKKYKI